MKIALITNYWKNSDGGGIKTYLVNLVEALQNKGADVSVLFREGDDPEHFCGGRNKECEAGSLDYFVLHSWQHHSYDPAIVETGASKFPVSHEFPIGIGNGAVSLCYQTRHPGGLSCLGDFHWLSLWPLAASWAFSLKRCVQLHLNLYLEAVERGK
jgi:hypothetical protein